MKQLKEIVKTKMRFIIALLAIGSFITACQIESNENNDTTLSGKWSWFKSSGGIAGQTYTPQSTGEIRTIEFINDSIFKQYRNGALLIETTYALTNIQGRDEVFIKYKEGRITSYIVFQDKNTLILADYADDGFEHSYRRQ